MIGRLIHGILSDVDFYQKGAHLRKITMLSADFFECCSQFFHFLRLLDKRQFDLPIHHYPARYHPANL